MVEKLYSPKILLKMAALTYPWIRTSPLDPPLTAFSMGCGIYNTYFDWILDQCVVYTLFTSNFR